MHHFVKKTKQLLVAKWQSFRAWQEHPITYRTDNAEHVCNNCGHRFKGNFCPVCSQPANHGRIGWLTLWQGFGQLWGIESRSGISTLWQLFLRPGFLVRDYISGKRQSYPPVKLLFILAAIIAIVQYFFPASVKPPVETGYRYLDIVLEWLQNHENINALISGCIFILPTWWLFRKAPRYPKHTIPEGFFLQVYVAILSFLFYLCRINDSGGNPKLRIYVRYLQTTFRLRLLGYILAVIVVCGVEFRDVIHFHHDWYVDKPLMHLCGLANNMTDATKQKIVEMEGIISIACQKAING